MSPKPLTPKQQRFVDEYLVDLNATQAAIRAGYSQRTAASVGSENLKKPEIAAAVHAGAEKRANRAEVNAVTVLRELLRLATVDVAGAFNPDGALKPIHEIPEDIRRAIAGIEVDEIVAKVNGTPIVIGHTKKVKFWDKKGALDSLGKHLKLFTEQIELSGNIGLADRLNRALARSE